MPRSGRLRNFIKECNESPRAEKLSFLPTFSILIIEIILLQHAISINEHYIIFFTAVLFIISVIETLLVLKEMNDCRVRDNFNRILTIKLDDFIIEQREGNVKRIIEKFIDIHPEYNNHRNKAYRIACQIMETHNEELWEKTLKTRMKRFIKKQPVDNVRSLLERFMNHYPEYKKDPGKVYHLAANMMTKQIDDQD